METKENIYSRGKIYKIISENCDGCYVGSTCKKLLSQRLSAHTSNFRQYEKDIGRYYSSFEILKYDDYSIILLEDYPCERKDQLLSRERYWKEQLKDSVNIYNAIRTKEDYHKWYNEGGGKEWGHKYYEDNKEHIREYGIKYREENREHKNEVDRNYYATHKEERTQYCQDNKEKIQEYRKAYIQEEILCESCNIMLKKTNFARHKKSKRHIDKL